MNETYTCVHRFIRTYVSRQQGKADRDAIFVKCLMGGVYRKSSCIYFAPVLVHSLYSTCTRTDTDTRTNIFTSVFAYSNKNMGVCEICSAVPPTEAEGLIKELN